MTTGATFLDRPSSSRMIELTYVHSFSSNSPRHHLRSFRPLSASLARLPGLDFRGRAGPRRSAGTRHFWRTHGSAGRHSHPDLGKRRTRRKDHCHNGRPSPLGHCRRLGSWRVDLNPISAGGPFQVTIAASNKLVFDDVLVGDVWVCSGQSNMEFPPKPGTRRGRGNPKGNRRPDPAFPRWPRALNSAAGPTSKANGSFARQRPCRPSRPWPTTSRRNYGSLQVIPSVSSASYWGGMPAQAFTSLSGLQKAPPFTHYVDTYEKVLANYPKARRRTLRRTRTIRPS